MRETTMPLSWRLLGRVLPSSIRERVYEPACLDLWREHATERGLAGQRLLLSLRFSGHFIGSLFFGLPRYFVDGGRLRGAGRAALTVMAVAGAAALIGLIPWAAQLITAAGGL